MTWHRNGAALSKKLTQIVRGGHERKIVFTDKHNTPVIDMPVLFFVVMALLMPIIAGILIFLFLISEYHAIITKSD